MVKKMAFSTLLIISFSLPCLGQSYDLAFSTYFGGSDWEHARDICVDDAGNIYIVGGTTSPNYPTTDGVFQRTQDFSGSQVGSGGYCDAFVTKFSPDGQLIWSTLLGGPNYDRAYGVEVDSQGYVYVAGRSGPGFPVTANALQPTFQGGDQGIYGQQNAFVAKIKPDGTDLQWCTYFGVGLLARDIAIDSDGDVYLPMNYQGYGPLPPAEWFTNAYMPNPAGNIDIGAAKLKSDGSEVLWATWFGGSGKEVNNSGIRVDNQKNFFLNFTTQSSDVPTTAGAADQSYNGGNDIFVAKFSPDGSSLIYGTYFGGSGGEEGNSTHNMAIDSSGNAYIATHTNSPNIPTTAGAFQSSLAGGSGDTLIVKFSPTGALLKCTYFGGTGADGIDGVYAGSDGKVYFTGNTDSTDLPVTPTAFQSNRSAPRDAIVVVLNPDFSDLEYCSYIGGGSYDDGRSAFLDSNENFYITGSTNGTGWPTLNPWQSSFAGGGGGQELCYEGGCYAGDVIVAKFNATKNYLGGDAELDGDVDILDFLLFKASYGTQTGATWQMGDFDGDADVDIFDFLILKANYGA